MNKKNILLAAAALAVAASAYYSYTTFVGPITIIERRDPIFSIFLNNKQKNFEESTDWYEVKIKYPEQNTPAAEYIFKQWNDFANENKLKTYKSRKEASKELGLDETGEQKYSFNADYKLVEGGTLFGTSTLSYIFSVYIYTGGAHGSNYLLAYTVDEFGKVYSAEDVLPTDKLANINTYVEKEIQKQRQELVKDPEISKDDIWVKEGTAPTRDNYNVVWPKGNNVVVSFGQYQVGSYAEGMFQVEVPKDLLK